MNCAIHPDIEATAPCARCGMSYCGDCLVTLREQRLCANCKGEALRDVMSGTQENRLPFARISARFVAQIVDRSMYWVLSYSINALRLVRYGKLAMTFGLRTARQGQIIFQLLYLMVFFLYEALMVAWRGQTLGKMLLRVRVVNPDGSQATRRAAFLRALVRLLLNVGVLSASLTGNQIATTMVTLILVLIDYGPGLFTAERVTAHDMLAKTRVVQAET